jgi:hypothetical protein
MSADRAPLTGAARTSPVVRRQVVLSKTEGRSGSELHLPCPKSEGNHEEIFPSLITACKLSKIFIAVWGTLTTVLMLLRYACPKGVEMCTTAKGTLFIDAAPTDLGFDVWKKIVFLIYVVSGMTHGVGALFAIDETKVRISSIGPSVCADDGASSLGMMMRFSVYYIDLLHTYMKKHSLAVLRCCFVRSNVDSESPSMFR